MSRSKKDAKGTPPADWKRMRRKRRRAKDKVKLNQGKEPEAWQKTDKWDWY